MFMEGMASVVGATAASKTAAHVGAGGGGQKLAIAARGASFARGLVTKLPLAHFGKVIENAVRDPDYMEVLLAVPRNDRQKIEFIRRMHFYALLQGHSVYRSGREEEDALQYDHYENRDVEPPVNTYSFGPPQNGASATPQPVASPQDVGVIEKGL
jgi:hypothetical protein